jgi:hypothetical protein
MDAAKYTYYHPNVKAIDRFSYGRKQSQKYKSDLQIFGLNENLKGFRRLTTTIITMRSAQS